MERGPAVPGGSPCCWSGHLTGRRAGARPQGRARCPAALMSPGLWRAQRSAAQGRSGRLLTFAGSSPPRPGQRAEPGARSAPGLLARRRRGGGGHSDSGGLGRGRAALRSGWRAAHAGWGAAEGRLRVLAASAVLPPRGEAGSPLAGWLAAFRGGDAAGPTRPCPEALHAGRRRDRRRGTHGGDGRRRMFAIVRACSRGPALTR